MKLTLSQNEIQKAIVEFINADTKFKISDKDVFLKCEWDYERDTEPSNFIAEINLDDSK